MAPKFSAKSENSCSAFVLRHLFQIASPGAANLHILTPNKQLITRHRRDKRTLLHGDTGRRSR